MEFNLELERLMQKEAHFHAALRFVRAAYAIFGVAVAGRGGLRHSSYEWINGLSTLLLIPGLALMRRMFRWKGGAQLEILVYAFACLSWTLGGAAECYEAIPYFDKAVHTLSGVLVSMLALALFRVLERARPIPAQGKSTACLFMLFASMAVAGMFELCEYALAPFVGRDLQHVLDTGVSDTMGDIFVCLCGTLVSVALLLRSFRGKHSFLTDAADAFALQNGARLA